MTLDFPPFKLLYWILDNYEKVKYDLATSNMPPYVPDFSGKLEKANLAMGSLTGIEELKDAISDLSGAGPENILVTNGASEANFLVCAALLSRGDDVLVERPFYEPLASVPKGLGSSVKFVDRKPIDFALDLATLEDSATPATKLLVITNLHNPSGAQIPDDVMKDLSETAGEKGFHVHCDEIFMDFAHSPSRNAFSFGGRVISTVGLSKFYGTGGFRVGWILAEEDILRRCRRVREHMAVTCCSFGEQAAVAVLREREEVKTRNRKILEGNSRTVVDWAREEGIEMTPWAGANVCFPRLPLENTLDFCKHLLDREVLVPPGEFFGLAGHVRIGLGCESSVLQEGLRRVSVALREFPA
ncbi:MAG: aminotransferase class I/II-fold pyridoxal phosphate-dependent enzyme [Thermoplasmata archaeon]